MTTNVSVIQSNPNPNPNRETNTIFARSFKQLQAAGGDILYLAGNLKFLREQIGKTQQELANLFGVEQKTMSSWECGSRTPGIEIIVELARYHGVSLDDLVLRDMKPAMPVYVLNLMYLRKKHGMTQQDISELASVLDGFFFHSRFYFPVEYIPPLWIFPVTFRST